MGYLKQFGKWYWFHFKRGVLTSRLFDPMPEYWSKMKSYIIAQLVPQAIILGLLVVVLLVYLIIGLVMPT